MTEILDIIQNRIQATYNPHQPFVIAVSGMDAAGKSSFAEAMREHLAETFSVTVVHIDDYHNPRSIRHSGADEVENFLHRTINFDLLERTVLLPLREEKSLSCQAQVLDFQSDTYSKEVTYQVAPGDIVIVEGIFLFRSAWRSYFDLRIFLKVAPETAIDRGVVRDAHLLGADTRRRYEQKYIPAQLRHFADETPETSADFVIDNNDFARPVLLKTPGI